MSDITKSMAAFDKFLAAAGAKVAAANSADPADVKALVHLLRQTADTLDSGDVSLGHFKAVYAFEFSRQMEAKAALRLELTRKGKAAKLKKIESVMAAIQSGHVNTVMAISGHYAEHPYVDNFKDN